MTATTMSSTRPSSSDSASESPPRTSPLVPPRSSFTTHSTSKTMSLTLHGAVETAQIEFPAACETSSLSAAENSELKKRNMSKSCPKAPEEPEESPASYGWHTPSARSSVALAAEVDENTSIGPSGPRSPAAAMFETHKALSAIVLKIYLETNLN